jgi:hypothetical protein
MDFKISSFSEKYAKFKLTLEQVVKNIDLVWIRNLKLDADPGDKFYADPDPKHCGVCGSFINPSLLLSNVPDSDRHHFAEFGSESEAYGTNPESESNLIKFSLISKKN